jgi:hypothetical protein
MQALMIVKVEVRPQAANCRFGRLILVQIDLLIFDASPQPRHKDIVQGPAPSIHTHLNACGLQAAGKIAAGKLRAWIAMKDLWLGCLESRSNASTQHPTASVMDTAHDTTYRLNQANTATK